MKVVNANREGSGGTGGRHLVGRQQYENQTCTFDSEPRDLPSEKNHLDRHPPVCLNEFMSSPHHQLVRGRTTVPNKKTIPSEIVAGSGTPATISAKELPGLYDS